MNAKILIVDDNEQIRDLFKDFLEAKGYRIQRARNGLEGIRKYKISKPDVVLMDGEMPVMNGYESTKGIKRLDPKAKIVMITGSPHSLIVKKTLSQGYIATVIQKPCDLNNLLQTVSSILMA